MLRAVLFDFDGLIVDTESAEYLSWQQVFAQAGLALELSDWIQCVGAGPDAWDVVGHYAQLSGQAADRDALHDAQKAIYQSIIDQYVTRPGIVSLLDQLASESIAYGIASSSLLPWVELHLTRIGLRHRFQAIKTRDIVGKAKPAPDLYLALCDELGVSPAEAIALEDSANGIRAARSAGVPVVACPNPITVHFDLSEADRIIESVAEIDLADLREIHATVVGSVRS